MKLVEQESEMARPRNLNVLQNALSYTEKGVEVVKL